jgi:hypothetical protein
MRRSGLLHQLCKLSADRSSGVDMLGKKLKGVLLRRLRKWKICVVDECLKHRPVKLIFCFIMSKIAGAKHKNVG